MKNKYNMFLSVEFLGEITAIVMISKDGDSEQDAVQSAIAQLEKDFKEAVTSHEVIDIELDQPTTTVH